MSDSVWYWQSASCRCVVHPVGSDDTIIDVWCMIQALCLTSMCCTPGMIRGSTYRRVILHNTGIVPHVSVLYIREDPRTTLPTFDTVWYWRCASGRYDVHLIGSEDPITNVWYCLILALCLTSVCCTSGRIREHTYRRLILHDTGVVSHIGVLYTRYDLRTSLPTLDTEWHSRCVSRRCFVHPVWSEDQITNVWYWMIPALCFTSMCCEPGMIWGPHYRRLILHDTSVVSQVGVLYIW